MDIVDVKVFGNFCKQSHFFIVTLLLTVCISIGFFVACLVAGLEYCHEK